MEPLCIWTQAMMPRLPAQESNSISLKRHSRIHTQLWCFNRTHTWNKLAQTITTITTPHKLQTQQSNYENLFCSFDAGWSASTYSQGEQKRCLAGNDSQLEEAAVRQMTRRGDHIEKEYKFMALGKPKSNFFCLYV